MASSKNMRGDISTTGDDITVAEGTNQTTLTNANTSGSGIGVNLPTLATNLAGLTLAQTWTAVQKFPQTGLNILGADANALIIKPNETLTADRTFNVIVNDTDRTINLSGNMVLVGDLTTAGAWTHTGAHTLGITTTANTTVTLPTTGTLGTLAGAEVLTNKEITALEITAGSTIDAASSGTLSIGGTNTTDLNLGKSGQTTFILGDLTVQGTTTTVNSTTLDVVDPNITLNVNGTSGDGSGLTVTKTGTNGSFVYEDALASKWKLGALGAEVQIADISTAQTLTNKTVDSDSNTITNIVNADIKAAAAIERSKVEAGTIDHVVINSGTGAFSSEATLAVSRGGTGAATALAGFDALAPTTTKGDLNTHNGSNSIRRAIGSDGQILMADAAQADGLRWATPVVANPMTTAGDIIYSSDGSGSPTRLAVGGTNQFLFESAGLPAWTTGLSWTSSILSITGGLSTLGGIAAFSRADATPSGTANTTYDDGVFGSTGTANTGITILSSTRSGISFGDAASTTIGQIRYNHSSNSMEWYSNSTVGLTLDSSQNLTVAGTGDSSFAGNLGVGTTAPDSLLHVYRGNSGLTPHSRTGLFVEDDTHNAISVLSSAGNEAAIYLSNGNSGSSTYSQIVFSNNELKLYNNNAQRLTIDSSGNVGIGATSPDTLLDVRGSNDNGFIASFDNADTSATGAGGVSIDTGATTTAPALRVTSNNGATSIIEAESNGNVGLGTATPAYKLHVQETDLSGTGILLSDKTKTAMTTQVSNGQLHIETGTNNVGIILGSATDAAGTEGFAEISLLGSVNPSELRFYVETATTSTASSRFSFLSDGTAQKITSTWSALSSDIATKKNIRDFDHGLETLMRIKPRYFEFNGIGETEDDGTEHVGMIAQEVAEVYPAMVEERAAEFEGRKLLTTNNSDLTYILVNAVKELAAQVAELQERKGKS